MRQMVSGNTNFYGLLKKTYKLSKPYFVGEKWLFAWSVLMFLISITVAQVLLNVLFTNWYKRFYDALQNMDRAAFLKELFFFSWIAAAYVSSAVIEMFVMRTYLLHWRSWMTKHLVNKWLADYSFYGLKLLKKEVDNPDQRIAQDISEFTDTLLTLLIKAIESAITLVAFTVVLWQISYVFSVNIFGYPIKIYGCFVWVAFIYAIAGTTIIRYVGKPLAGLLFAQEKREANFRFSLIRVRENAEPISFYKAIKFEKIFLLNSFHEIIKNTKRVISKNSQIICLSAFYQQIALLLPFIVAFPFFFARKITLGSLIQIGNSFDNVNKASSWIISSYQGLSLLQAVAGRLEQFSESLDLWAISYNNNKIKIIRKGNDIKIEKLELHLPSGRRLFAIDKINIKGKSYLIEGRSGAGKTTFFKALSGLWVSGVGKITLPRNKKILFISQKNYMPIGKLRFCFTYPSTEDMEHKELRHLMRRIGLEYLIDRLEEEGEWGHVLSLGEQQKIAIIRAIVIKPDVIFLDEATSAMDRKSKEIAYELLKSKLTKAKVISIGHERYLRKFHDEIISITDGMVEVTKLDRESNYALE